MNKLNLTQHGTEAIHRSMVEGAQISLTEFALSSAHVSTLSSASTTMEEIVYRAAATSVSVSTEEQAVNIAMNVPASEGGWTVRSLGVFDSAGILFAYADFPESYKPRAATGITAAEWAIKACLLAGENAAVFAPGMLAEVQRAIDDAVNAEAQARYNQDVAIAQAVNAHFANGTNPHAVSYAQAIAAWRNGLVPSGWSGGYVSGRAGAWAETFNNQHRVWTYTMSGTHVNAFVGTTIQGKTQATIYAGDAAETWGFRADTNGIEAFGKPLKIENPTQDTHAVPLAEVRRLISEAMGATLGGVQQGMDSTTPGADPSATGTGETYIRLGAASADVPPSTQSYTLLEKLSDGTYKITSYGSYSPRNGENAPDYPPLPAGANVVS